ncbi:hypothetical protein ABBQ38_002046 [Trebouxia sp. C0009 RCD-2024]
MSDPAQLNNALALPQVLASQTQVTSEWYTGSACAVVKSKHKGKGRIVQRKGAQSQAPVVAKAPLHSHLDIQNGECAHYPVPRFLPRLAGGWVEAKDLNQATQHQQAYGHLRAGSPVKLTGTPLVSSLRKTWGLDHLVKLMPQDQGWSVLCSTQKHNLFIETDLDKNVFGSYYHIREPQNQQLQMTFAEYAQCAKTWTTKKVCFKNKIMQRQQQQEEGHTPAPMACLPAALCQELQGSVRWDWLQALQKLVRFGSASTVTLQAASFDSLMPAQYQPHERLLAQVTGCQRILLIPPNQAFHGMYPYPVHHPYDTYSMVDLEKPDVGQWPHNTDVKGLRCVVKPGDVLYLPAYWFVHAQQLETVNINLTFHMGMGLRARPPACIPLQLSRHLECRLANVEGVANVRHWLQLIGYCDEQDWIELSTVKGYRRIVMCQEVRDELDINLALPEGGQQEEEEWQRVLIAMCDGRLLPTPWLNKDFREPLYLTDTTTQIEDVRSAEERKYPQLFRHTLKAQGWSFLKSKHT